ncbi:hypothetical protein LCGC14_0372850 [marine sediment metagenome]|uniref:Uncharacterized protein n=1 Tax=marine sediment metagenome TaxID=412755 RepID=A0A0F9TAR5_9ZZZZ
MEITVFRDADKIKEGQFFVASKDSVEGRGRATLKRAYEIPSGASMEFSNFMGERLIAEGYVEHTIDSKTKQQKLRLSESGRIALDKLFQLYDTEVTIKGMTH